MQIKDFDQHQRETAKKLGYGDDVDRMNAEHDPLHQVVCDWLGIPSFALQPNETLDAKGRKIAKIEERAVLSLQRLCRTFDIKPQDLRSKLK